jgi:hypothetical protein
VAAAEVPSRVLRHSKFKSTSLAVFAACLVGCVFILCLRHSRAINPISLGQAFPESVLSLVPQSASSKMPTMVVVSGSRTAEGERAFRYIATRSSQNLPILPTLLIAPSAVVESFPSLGIACSGECRAAADGHDRLRKTLGVEDQDFHLFIVDTYGKVVFSSDLAEPQDIRQLNEKFLTGKVTYPSTSHPDVSHLVGEQFSAFPVVRLSDGAHVEMYSDGGDAPKRLLVLTARCPDCSLDGLLEASSLLKASSALSVSGSPLSILFSSRFAQWQIKELESRYKIDTTSYQATASIPGIEDLATLSVFVPSDACLITLSSKNTIVSIKPLALKNGQLVEATANVT